MDLALANIEALANGESGSGSGCRTLDFGRYTGNAGREYMITFYCHPGIAPACLEGFEIWYGGDPWNGGTLTYNQKTQKPC